MIKQTYKQASHIHQNPLEKPSSKSSTAFISKIITKPTYGRKDIKSTINVAKVLKPSASIFKKYIHEKIDDSDIYNLSQSIEKSTKENLNYSAFTTIDTTSMMQNEETTLKFFREDTKEDT